MRRWAGVYSTSDERASELISSLIRTLKVLPKFSIPDKIPIGLAIHQFKKKKMYVLEEPLSSAFFLNERLPNVD